uniref:Ovule protein n=1 Tax=Heterorhabditis bacteriophora TaxID=37862 RepID=A0A1I7XEL4_HETBA
MYSTSIMSGFHYNLSAAKAPESAPRPAPSRGKDADANRLVVQEVTLLQMELKINSTYYINVLFKNCLLLDCRFFVPTWIHFYAGF